MLIAHRGASQDAPENTLAAFRLGWEQGSDAVEVDVHLSRDGRIIAIHDDNTERTAGNRRKARLQTFDELQSLDAGGHKGPQWAGERIPALEQVLATVPRGRGVFIEIKCGVEIVPPLTELLRRSPLPPKQATLIGFNADVVAAAKQANPHHPVLWLCDIERERSRRRRQADELVAVARRAGLDGLDVQARAALDRAFVEAVKAAGMTCYTWTVNDPAEARRLFAAGVDGITTDRPGWLRRRL